MKLYALELIFWFFSKLKKFSCTKLLYRSTLIVLQVTFCSRYFEKKNPFLGPVCAVSGDPLRGYCVESRSLFISLRHQADRSRGRVWWVCIESTRASVTG